MILTYISILMVVLGYLSGSLCSAVIVCKAFGLGDPREQGSNNPGATNVLRLHGKKYAAMVLIGDMLKGTIPVVIGHLLGVSDGGLGYIALACTLGHIFPIFFKFKGGKGVATALGTYFGLNIFLGLTCLAIWIIVAYFKKYSSLASLITVCFAPLYAVIFMKSGAVFFPVFLMSFIIIGKHHENIQRLWRGEESRLNIGK
jgi:glycerol-3-phosphate acyltransferase PlsY